MAKLKSTPPNESPEGVDMDRIKAMMGPFPNETKQTEPTAQPNQVVQPETPPPTTAPEIPKKNKDVAAAAEEANQVLKSMSSDLGKAQIIKVDDEATVATQPLPEEAPIENEGLAADDPTTVKAVNDIVAHEADEILEAEDEKLGLTEEEPEKTRFRDRLKAAWAKPAVRWATIGILLFLIAGAATVPATRYYALNLAGVRASLSLKVVDNSTLLPLKNVTVSIGGVTAQTDSNGQAKLEHLKLGDATLHVTKRAFADISEHIIVGWGSNPKGQFRLSAAGAQYSFVVTDYLSGKPIENAEASSGEGNAVSDKDGKIILTLDTSGKSDTDELDISIAAANYRTENIKITAGNKEASSVKLVTARKSIFTSKRSGKYDVYTIDVDGKNEKRVVAGTGIERDDLALVPMQNSDIAALVATRENARNNDGYLLSTLYLLDSTTGTLTKADQSEQIQLIGWSSDGRLIYVKIAAGASAANPKRHRLQSLNSKNSSDNKELASANAFNDVVMAGDRVLYAPSNALQESPAPGLFVVGTDNTGQQNITTKEVLNIFRTNYDTVTVKTADLSYIYKIGGSAASLSPSPSPSGANRLYVDNIASAKSLWIGDDGGKGTVMSYDKNTKKDTTLKSADGIKLPAYWLTDKIAVYRINNGKEIADYAVSTDGGDAHKITDVTDAAGIGRWYYY
jgi:hypothetical protein